MQSSPLNQPPEFFSCCETETLYQLNNNSSFLSPSSLWQPLRYFLSLSLSTLGTSCRWNYTILVFLWLSSFIYHVFKIHPYCTMYQNLFSILGLIILHCMQIIHFVYPFTYGWAFGLFLLLDYCEKCCYEHEYTSIYLNLCFHFFEYMPRSDFWRNCHTVFHSNYIILHSHPECTRVIISSYSYWYFFACPHSFLK